MKELKINEVRIGNWVNMVLKNEKSDTMLIAADLDPIIRGTRKISGIPISHVQLLAWGFTKQVYLRDLSRYKRSNLIWQTDGILKIEGHAEIVTLALGIKYSHQLQNIWFLLKGEEL